MRATIPVALATVAVLGLSCRRARPEPTIHTTEEPVHRIDVRCPRALLDAREGGLDPDRYVAPPDGERRALRDAIASLLAGRGDAKEHASAAGFELVDLEDDRGVLVREVASKRRGGGAYVVRPGARSRLVVQAPHTFHDEGTLPLAYELYARANAAALFVSTAHRYKAAPKTAAGSWPADVAHARDSFFQAATEGALRARPAPPPGSLVVVQLHGYGEREGGGSMVVSAGVRTPGHPLVARATTALGRIVSTAASANVTGSVLRFPEDHGELGATTNVQGSIVREAGGQFLHLELAASLRRVLLEDDPLRASFLATLADALEGA